MSFDHLIHQLRSIIAIPVTPFTDDQQVDWAARSLAMLRCLQAGDYPAAMQIWAEIKPFEDLQARHDNANNVSVVKEALAQLGLSSRTVRPPISELSEQERAEVAGIIAAWNVVQR